MDGKGRGLGVARWAVGAALAIPLAACAFGLPQPASFEARLPAEPVAQVRVLSLPPVPGHKPTPPAATAGMQAGHAIVPLEKPMRFASGQPAGAVPTAVGLTPAPPAPPAPAGYHEVAPGDTIYNISKRYGVQARVLVAANDLPAPYDIAIGQRLRLPATATLPTPKPAAGSTVSAAIAGLLPTPSSKPLAPPPPRSQALFDWPLRGELVSSFGPKPGGLHNDGINIAANEGTAVRAAESGVVVYVGNELRGYGNLLLLRHADGWMSAYAHVRDITVSRGQLIRRGQVVARVGRSGRIDRPQLHFELRKGRDAVDPTRYLAPLDGAPQQALSRAARLGVPPDPG